MVKHEVHTVWKEKLAFESHIDGKHIFKMDTAGELGDDSAASPKKVLLSSLAGCTGMDVVSLLNKMRVPFTGLEIDVDADLGDDHPRVYQEIRLKYKVYGEDLDRSKVEKAISLSKEKYCGISAMLEKNCPIKYQIDYISAANKK
ncbi:MAG: OsmC family protein [Bacteroidia bacterium]|nr:OsmC family protein [Bacteroidia bacterium]